MKHYCKIILIYFLLPVKYSKLHDTYVTAIDYLKLVINKYGNNLHFI